MNGNSLDLPPQNYCHHQWQIKRIRAEFQWAFCRSKIEYLSHYWAVEVWLELELESVGCLSSLPGCVFWPKCFTILWLPCFQRYIFSKNGIDISFFSKDTHRDTQLMSTFQVCKCPNNFKVARCHFSTKRAAKNQVLRKSVEKETCQLVTKLDVTCPC